MRRINRSTKEDMQKWPWTHNQNPSMEYSAGAIKVCCRSDDVFGQNRMGSRDFLLQGDLMLKSPGLCEGVMDNAPGTHLGPTLLCLGFPCRPPEVPAARRSSHAVVAVTPIRYNPGGTGRGVWHARS